MKETFLSKGLALCADVTAQETIDRVRYLLGDEKPALIMADPEYGDIVSEAWDKSSSVTGLKPGTAEAEQAFVDWMIRWTLAWAELLPEGGAMYVWGGVGKPKFRPFLAYMSQIERASAGKLTLSPITWKKKRAYGIQHNYLFCREELAYLCKGDVKKPRVFNVPLLEKERGYEGYDKEHPAKSKFLRRSNVWDETELLRGKRHRCQKAPRVNEIPIEVHTSPGELVIDLFAASMSASEAAAKLGRHFIAIESDVKQYEKSVLWLQENT